MRAIILLCSLAFVAGCAARSETTIQGHRQTKTITRTVRQEITPTGQIVELTTISSIMVNENTGETQAGTTEVMPPKIVGDLASLAGALAGGGTGQVVRAGVEKGVDWLTTILGTLGGAGATAAAGHVVIGRVLKRQRDEVIQGVERAKGNLSSEAWEALTSALEKEASADTKVAVARRTARGK